MPVQRSNGSNVAAWMTRVPPATGSSRQLHSLSKPDAVTRSRKRESGRASRLSTRASSRRRPRRARAERVVAAAGQGGAAGPRRSSGKRMLVAAGSWSVAHTVRGVAWTKTRRSTGPRSVDSTRAARRLPVPPVPTAIVSRRSGARPSSSRGRRRSIRGARRQRRRASRSGTRRPSSGGGAGA